MDEINKYLKDNKKGDDDIRLVPRMIMNDGFSMSVQATTHSYCTPRNDGGNYTSVEIGYPSECEPLILGWVDGNMDEDGFDPRHVVYARVPIGVANEVAKKHGGIRMTERQMLRKMFLDMVEEHS